MIYEYDKWLSDIIRYGAYKVILDNSVLEMPEDSFLYSKIPLNDNRALDSLINKGFGHVSTNILFTKNINNNPYKPYPNIRYAASSDRDGVKNVANTSFEYSRFHTDPLFPTSLANRIKQQWASEYFNGNRGDEMIVAVDDVSNVVGFLLLIFKPILTIDLIAVDRGFRKHGIAKGMIKYAESQFNFSDDIQVGTQLTNAPSIRLYTSLEFRPTSIEYVMHYHGEIKN